MDIDKFLSGEVAYIVDRNTVDKLLELLEVNSNLCWLSGMKPTEYDPFNSYLLYGGDECVTLGLYKTDKGDVGLGYNEKWWFESNNYKVEVF